MAYFSYTFSGDTVVKTFNAYSFTGDVKVRYQGSSPTNLAEAVRYNSQYVGAGSSGSGGGGGISIFSGS